MKKNVGILKLLRALTVVCVMGVLASCAGTYTRMANSDMQVTTNMDKTIWLDPTVPEKTYIYVQARNTSDNSEFSDVAGYIKRALEYKGYNITNNPDNATFVLQANVLRSIMMQNGNGDEAKADALMAGGLGYAIAKNNTNTLKSAGIGLAAGLATMYFDANTKDSTYVVQTDIRVTKKGGKNPQTAVLTVTAHQVNLEPQDVSILLKRNIANSLAGLF